MMTILYLCRGSEAARDYKGCVVSAVPRPLGRRPPSKAGRRPGGGDGLTIHGRSLQNPVRQWSRKDCSAVPPPPIEEATQCPLLDRDPEAWLRCCTARFLPVARRLAGDDATARGCPAG